MCGLSQVNPSPVYLQTCTVCEGQLSGRNKWLIHLIQDSHQKLARLECLEKWVSELRKCSLVIYTSVNLTPETVEEIVKYFSNQTSNGVTLVTDFVWWEDRPRLGILQFESRDKMKEVLKTIGACNNSSKISINGCQTVQVRPVSKLMELEWQAILPSYHQPTKTTTLTSNRRENVSPNDPNSGPELNNSQQASSGTKAMEPLDPEAHRPSKRLKLDSFSEPINRIQDDKNVRNSTFSILLSTKPLAYPMTRASHPLQFQYWTIRKSMLIPDSQYAYAMLAVESLKKNISNLGPKMQLTMFRHCYLKLKYPVATEGNLQNELMLYAYQPGEDSILVYTKLREYLSTTNEFKLGKSSDKDTIKLVQVSTNVPLTVVTPKRKGCLMETQLCRLIEYLCEFDPRCHPLITLACCWISGPSIKLSGKYDPKNPLDLPPHYTIQWLVIFFLSQGKYIPTPAEILNRNPDKSVIDDVTGANIGFHCDPNYVKEWRSRNTSDDVRPAAGSHREYTISTEESSEEFILSVIQLFQKFVSFSLSKVSDRFRWILNTFNGVLIDVKNLHSSKVHYRWRQAMKDSDVVTLQNAFIRKNASCKLYMTHPILLSHKFVLPEDIQARLRTGKRLDSKLNVLFNNIRSLGVQQALKNINSLEHLLTHE